LSNNFQSTHALKKPLTFFLSSSLETVADQVALRGLLRNCTTLLDALARPHVGRFAPTLNPVVHAAQKALARPPSWRREVSQ
jgi:hypothetical protein